MPPATVGSSQTRPWLRFYGDVPHSLEYPRITLYEALLRTVQLVPEAVAYDFLGKSATYRELGAAIDRCASALAALGLRRGDGIAIAMPTSPQGVVAFYAANKLGALPSLIHPLSTPEELEVYLRISRPRLALTLDACYPSFSEVRGRTTLELLILARLPDCLTPLGKLGFWLTRGRKIPSVPADRGIRWWSHLMGVERAQVPRAASGPDDPAAILYSGGTTGTPKGILLSNLNLISEGMQVAAWSRMRRGDSILAILPLFHGFGLGVCINAAFMAGGQAIMTPSFTPDLVGRLIKRKRPNLLVGVPTLFEALARHPALRRADLSCLRATFSGADTLPRPVKERFEALVERRGGRVKLLEGYGLTEAVTAIMAMPLHEYREGSIGVPFPDMQAQICEPGTTRALEAGREGEICVCGPAVMLGYLNAPEETAQALKTHGDGSVWLHTGDLGRMDEDGFFYFTCRLKRMIKSSGFNVYPAQVEAVLYRHPAVKEACVVGLPDASQGERVKAFVVPKAPVAAGERLAAQLIEHCRQHLIKWSCPREVEFRAELPRTRLGKIDFQRLAREREDG